MREGGKEVEKPVYYLRMYDMIIKSDISIIEGVEVLEECSVDVRINLEEIPKQIKELIDQGEVQKLEKEKAWFIVPDIAFFYIYDGSNIICSVFEGALMHDVVAYLLGCAFCFIFIQRGLTPLHGSALIVNNKGLIITGRSGAGKSSLTAAFLQSGYPFLADDVAVLSLEKNKTNIIPSFPEQKLCRNVALGMGYDINSLRYLGEEKDKFAVRLDKLFCSSKIELGAIVEVIPHTNKELEIHEIRGHDKIGTFIRNIFQSFIYEEIGLSVDTMKRFLNIVEKLPMYRILRPENDDTILVQKEKLLEMLVNTNCM